VKPLSRVPKDFDPEVRPILEKAGDFTITRMEGLYSMVQSVRYVSKAKLPGAIVECGVYRGGSMLAAALTLESVGDLERELYLFDTFEGMTAPTVEDGAVAQRLYSLDGNTLNPIRDSIACRSPLEEVRATMGRSGYPGKRIHYVKGRVEDTLPGEAPERIAILRLDTDWYQSTKHELEHLFPRLVQGGVLIIDDYGHWEGSRKACDEYFAKHAAPIFLQRIDESVRSATKI
jgi:O-methyltransferase